MPIKLSIAAERVTGPDEFERYLEIAKERDLGIEVQEFYLHDLMNGDWQGRLAEYQTLLDGFERNLSLHNAFHGIEHLGMAPDVLALTKKKYDFMFMIAKELGCKEIISHFTWNPYVTSKYIPMWQMAEVKFWEPYVNQAAKDGFVITGENTAEPRPDLLKPIFDEFASDHFKLNLDVGHVNLHSTVPVEDWVSAFGQDLVYVHAHNNYGDYDAHNPVAKGTFNFDHFFNLLDKYETAPHITTEIYDDDLPKSLDYLAGKIADSQVYPAA